MRTISPCSNCGAPVSLKMSKCPHCSATNPRGVVFRTASAVAAFIGGASITSTLAACYGGPCADGNEPECPGYIPHCTEVSQQPKIDDADGDGYCLAYDCNEKDPKINRAAVDVPGDGIDQNCNGQDQSK